MYPKGTSTVYVRTLSTYKSLTVSLTTTMAVMRYTTSESPVSRVPTSKLLQTPVETEWHRSGRRPCVVYNLFLNDLINQLN